MTSLLLVVLAASPADEAAAGTRAFNAGDRPTATTHFRAALKSGAPPQVHNAARHGLALCLIAADPPDWKQALPLLHPPAEEGNNPDRGRAWNCWASATAVWRRRKASAAAGTPTAGFSKRRGGSPTRNSSSTRLAAGVPPPNSISSSTTRRPLVRARKDF